MEAVDGLKSHTKQILKHHRLRILDQNAIMCFPHLHVLEMIFFDHEVAKEPKIVRVEVEYEYIG